MCEISTPFTSSKSLHVSGIVLGIENNNVESDTVDLQDTLEVKDVSK